MNEDVLVQTLGVQMKYVNLRLFAAIILMTVGMEVMRLAVEPAILHSFAARMETVSATLMCATLPMTVETTVMNSDVTPVLHPSFDVHGIISAYLHLMLATVSGTAHLLIMITMVTILMRLDAHQIKLIHLEHQHQAPFQIQYLQIHLKNQA